MSKLRPPSPFSFEGNKSHLLSHCRLRFTSYSQTEHIRQTKLDQASLPNFLEYSICDLNPRQIMTALAVYLVFISRKTTSSQI